MSDSTTNLDQIIAAANAAVRVNENFDAMSPAALYGRHASTTTGLIWGLYGGRYSGIAIANREVILTASATNYIVASRTTGDISVSTAATNWNDTSNFVRLYLVVAGSSTVTTYEDHRQAIGVAAGGGGGGTSYTLPPATVTTLGGVKVGTGLSVAADGTLASAYSLPAATTTVLGGVKVGSGLAVTADGTISATGGTGGFTNPMTTAGDLIAAGVSGTPGRLGIGTTGQVLTVASGAPTWATPATGGGGALVNFTEFKNISPPNDGAIPLVGFYAIGSATNIDASFSPKGNGAVSAGIPDNGVAGGNKRGAYAVDWQTIRSLSSSVAAGQFSTISGGNNNACNNSGATVAGGINNISGGNLSVVSGGQSNIASGFFSMILGGIANKASGLYSTAFGDNCTSSGAAAFAYGSNCVADGDYSKAEGQFARSRGMKGVAAWSSTIYTTAADTQVRTAALGAFTSGVTPTALVSAGDGINQLNLNLNSAYLFDAKIVARSSTGVVSAWSLQGLIKNVGGTMSMVGTPVLMLIAQDAGAAMWTVSAIADNTLKVLTIQAVGAAATSITWTCGLTSVETTA